MLDQPFDVTSYRSIVINAILRDIRRTLKLNSVPIGIPKGCHPHPISEDWCRRFDSTGRNLTIDLRGIFTDEHYGDAQPQFTLWSPGLTVVPAEILQHEASIPKLKPTPSNGTSVEPMVLYLETQSINVESEGGLHV